MTKYPLSNYFYSMNKHELNKNQIILPELKAGEGRVYKF